MRNQEELAILTGFLDFYSDRATAHASFVVAELFGIYTVYFGQLMLEHRFPLWLFFLLCGALLFINIYSFLNFGYYATMAEIVRKKLAGTYLKKYDDEIRFKLARASLLHEIFRKIKKGLGSLRLLVFFIIWVLAVLLPFVWILLLPN